jgi:7-keto-8-aminopelargonate synthetase-like enzyme
MHSKYLDLVYNVIQSSSKLGVAHLTTDNKGFYNNKVEINQKCYTSFSLCDYLGLSNDQKIVEGAIKALQKNGVYTAVSKTYIKLDLYDEAENLLSQIFGKKCLLFPRTTLAHLGVLPIIVDDNDAVILDHQVHSSVKLGADLLKGYGKPYYTIRHNNFNALEDKIKELQTKHQNIWFLTDGIFSMYGDKLPINDLIELTKKYEQLKIYIDDAHGMSWTGKNGNGYIISETQDNENIIVTTSLGKGFGAGGGVTICNNEEMLNKISACSIPLMFTSPVTPATLGAIVESSKIHLSDQIYILQKKLNDRINYFKNKAKELEIPIVDYSDTPIFYIAAGKPDMCCEIGNKLMKKGIYINGGVYPSVPYNNAGVRAVLSVNHSLDDIKYLLENLKIEISEALKLRGITIEQILKYY